LKYFILVWSLIIQFNLNAADSIDYSKYYKQLTIKSPKALIYDAETGEIIYQKKAHERSSIASLTKLMTAMVLIDSNLNLDEMITISKKIWTALRVQNLGFGLVQN
jgi:D-alanyl-D-alanine endopeptidase (penicillin-binding protein 7)